MKPWPGHPLARYERPWGLGTYLFATFVIGCQMLGIAGALHAILIWAGLL